LEKLVKIKPTSFPSFFEKGTGLDKSSQYYFSKNLTELNLKEKATIISITKGVVFLKFCSSKLEQRVDFILHKFTIHNKLE
jgi:membrane peptidoglycan carboxypeptidase